jgi:hypothetical protein
MQSSPLGKFRAGLVIDVPLSGSVKWGRHGRGPNYGLVWGTRCVKQVNNLSLGYMSISRKHIKIIAMLRWILRAERALPVGTGAGSAGTCSYRVKSNPQTQAS